jgi:hypothetical protein
VSDAACPKCQLPIDDGAWYCDGCGHEFSTDYERVRATLGAELARSRRTLVVNIVVACVVAGVLVYVAMLGLIYIAVPLGVAVLGSIGHAVHRISVMREHVRTFARKHPPLPVA